MLVRLAFLASTFVPIEGMHAIPEPSASDPLGRRGRRPARGEHGTESDGSWPLKQPVVAMTAWRVLIIAACGPVAVHRFRATTV